MSPVLSETGTLMRRGLEYIVRNPGIYWVRTSEALLTALPCAYLWL